MTALDTVRTSDSLEGGSHVSNSDNGRLRWLVSFATALIAHGLVGALVLRWYAEVGPVEPTATIVVELAPMLALPEVQELETLPTPQQVQAENRPDKIEKDVEEDEDVAGEKVEAKAEVALDQPSGVKEGTDAESIEPPSQTIETVEIEEKSDVELTRRPKENDKSRTDVSRSEPEGPKPREQTAHPKPVKPVQNKPQKRALNVTATMPQTALARQATTSQAPAIGAPSNSNALPNWKSQVIGMLERHKRYPPEAQARQEYGTSNLAFSLNRQGRVTSAHIAGSSGSAALDAETLSLVQRIQPFPPPPPEVGGAQISLVVAIRYNSR